MTNYYYFFFNIARVQLPRLMLLTNHQQRRNSGVSVTQELVHFRVVFDTE